MQEQAYQLIHCAATKGDKQQSRGKVPLEETKEIRRQRQRSPNCTVVQYGAYKFLFRAGACEARLFSAKRGGCLRLCRTGLASPRPSRVPKASLYSPARAQKRLIRRLACVVEALKLYLGFTLTLEKVAHRCCCCFTAATPPSAKWTCQTSSALSGAAATPFHGSDSAVR